MLYRFAAIFVITATCIFAASRPPYSGTIFDFPDAFLDTDPSCLTDVTYQGQENRRVYDRRVGSVNLNVYVYLATFSDGVTWDMMVNPEFSQSEAQEYAEEYARLAGQMPHCLREGVTGAAIHDGGNAWGGGNPLTIHTGMGENTYKRMGIMTETLIHESTHASFDRRYYNDSWAAAANADGNYISTYARDNPRSEDHAETFLCWLVVRYKSDRVDARHITNITGAVPNRLEWYDNMNFNVFPITGTGVAHDNGKVRSAPLTVLANGPNPFLFATTIGYTLEKPSPVALQILDMKGRVIRTLAKENAGPGTYQKVWNAYDDAGKRVPSGTYFCQLIAGKLLITKNLVVLP
ncbi:MAG: T9SS type A sorting domain-containing protein [Chitinispirillaceae bacterium]|nr:T9SS type A sorting domain-containing protein [Chitinispirillaceae bacterium]